MGQNDVAPPDEPVDEVGCEDGGCALGWPVGCCVRTDGVGTPGVGCCVDPGVAPSSDEPVDEPPAAPESAGAGPSAVPAELPPIDPADEPPASSSTAHGVVYSAQYWLKLMSVLQA